MSSDNQSPTSTSETPPASEASSPSPEAVIAPTDTRRRAVSRWLGALLVIAVVVIVALAATLRHQQQQLDTFGREATTRLDNIVTQANSARDQARQALTRAEAMAGQVGRLEQRVQETADEQRTLTQSYRDLISGNDEATLVDVEQSLMMAAEQLQVAGRIPSAIAALQLAEARLARADRPAFLPAQQAIGRDMNRLQAVPIIDLRAVAKRIDRLIASARHLPVVAVGASVTQPDDLASATQQPPAEDSAASPADAPANWWERVWQPVSKWSHDVREVAAHELRELVHVRRVETADALLLAPDQTEWLRTNITLRLLEARMALISRERSLWQSNIEEIERAVERYADQEQAATRNMLKELQALRDLDPAPTLPALTDSLNAVRGLLANVASDTASTTAEN